MKLSQKQIEYINSAKKRWNFKIGAVRSGKTYLDYIYTIPRNILLGRGKEGLNVLLGVTQGTIERNVLDPMRKNFGSDIVSNINSDNICYIFGEVVYCLGAEKKSQVSKIQGSTIKYSYGDEVPKWNEEVFGIIKSRLSLAYSRFDGTGNPEGNTHWLKKFLDNEKLNIYKQELTLYDNPFLDPFYIKNIEMEYAGTVYFDRYILGKWCRAEGAIYKRFANNNEIFITDKMPRLDEIEFINCGMDFGGNKSSHTIVATAILKGFKGVVPIAEAKSNKELDPVQLEDFFEEFVLEVLKLNGRRLFVVRCDNAEPVLIRGLKQRIIEHNLSEYVAIRNAQKNEINSRIELVTRLFGLNRISIYQNCKELIKAFNNAVYDEKSEGERLDEVGPDNPVDMLDAFEYSIEEFTNYLINAMESKAA